MLTLKFARFCHETAPDLGFLLLTWFLAEGRFECSLYAYFENGSVLPRKVALRSIFTFVQTFG
jgi:hypothetical protein